MRANSLFLSIFGVFFIAFAIFWMISAARFSVVMSMFGMIFVIVGLFVIYTGIRSFRGKGTSSGRVLLDPGAEQFNADLGYKGETTSTDAIYCPFCGSPVKDAEHVFCKTCGRRIV